MDLKMVKPIFQKIFIFCKSNRLALAIVVALIAAVTFGALYSGSSPSRRDSTNNALKSKSEVVSKQAKSDKASSLKSASDSTTTSNSTSPGSSSQTSSTPSSDSSSGSNPDSGSNPAPGSSPTPSDPGSPSNPDNPSAPSNPKLREIVCTDSKAGTNTLPTCKSTFSCSSMSWLYIYTLWEYIPGYHKQTVLLYTQNSLFNQYQVQFNMDEAWQYTHDVKIDLSQVDEVYPIYIYTGFGAGGWESRLLGTWKAEIYLDAPDFVWDPSQGKYVWQGEGDTTCDGVAHFDLTN